MLAAGSVGAVEINSGNQFEPGPFSSPSGVPLNLQPYNWVGRGAFHLTHRNSYNEFANYVQTAHSELVTPVNGMTVAQTLMANPDLISANTPNGRALAALTAGRYWQSRQAMRNNADLLNFATPVPDADRITFDRVSRAVGRADSEARWRRYRLDIVPAAAAGGNPYESLRATLARVGITTQAQQGGQSQFTLLLNARTPLPLGTQHLLAPSVEVNDAYRAAFDPLAVDDLVAYAQSELGIAEGELDMWYAEPPLEAAVNPPAIYLAANANTQQKVASALRKRILGVCQAVTGPEGSEREQGIYPEGDADSYMYRYERRANYFGDEAVTRIVQPPKHGKLTLHEAYKNLPLQELYTYTTTLDDGYDTFVIEVEKNGVKLEIRYRVEIAVSSLGGSEGLCPRGRVFWKISTDSPQDGPNMASWQQPGELSKLLGQFGNAQIGFSDVPGAVLGTTTGEGNNATITLSATAAGHGWYIDYTPYLNEEYLPTANPNEWIAKADSEAAGKMDMLSVLLHEYGHALGIEHSASAHDYMATTLAPGVRRLPSADELALMAKLAGDLRLELAGDSTPSPDTPSSPLPSVPLGGSLGLALLGRLRGNRYGGWNVAVDSVSPLMPSGPQYAVAANPKLSNTEFAGGQGWSTTGDVRFQDGAATLTETAVSQTRLNQVFIVGENDRFLSFTVADTALDDADQAPDDAFEVALLDANTGASLLGGTGLTRNDAFLNLQADGTERKSQAVTSLRNADDQRKSPWDGSRTYLVDLAGIPAGTAVNLAFDLIGFGKGAAAVSSHLTIRDLRIGVPQAKDDSATLAEDSTISIAALANDRGLQMSAQQPGFVPVIVDAPAHGQVTINAGGTFSLTPDQDWNGDDQFTYAPKEVPLGDKLSDGYVDSNLATINLTVTAVNDAPVAVG